MPYLRFAALTVAYVVVARLSLTVAFVHGTVSPVWPPTGFAIAALTLWGPRLWPAIAFGAVAANTLVGDPMPVAAGIAVGNTLEAVLGALALRRMGVWGEVVRFRDALVLLAVAVLAPLPSASGGVLSLTLGGFSSWARLPWVWLVWWVGDFMGALVILPLMLAWLGPRASARLPHRPVEFLGVLTLAVVAVSVAYRYADALAILGVEHLPISPFLFLPVLWAVLRLRPRETVLVMALAAALAIVFTVTITQGEAIGPLVWLQLLLLCLNGGSLLLVGALNERVQAAQTLVANEIRFRTIYEQAAVGMAQVALDGRLLDVNGRLCEMLGYDRDELLTKRFKDVTGPEFHQIERRLLGEMLARRRDSYVIEKCYQRKDGTLVCVRVTSSLAVDADPAYRISIVEDITESKQVMAALEEAKARLEFALEGARASLWDWDIPTNRVRWSDEYYRLTGLDRSVPPSFDTWLSTVVPEDRERISEATRMMPERKERSFRVEFRVGHPEQGVRWLMGIGQVTYAEDGTPLRISGLNIDITDLKHAEEEARAAKKEAERANQAKSRFLAVASHDLRQPIQALMLLNTALSYQLKGHPSAPVVQTMTSSLDALERLLTVLLDISRLDAGTTAVDIQAVSVGRVIERMAEEYSSRAASQGLSFRTVGSSAWTCTDLTLLERIVRNLIENALRYTERGAILIGCRRRQGTLRLCVLDTGIGISQEHQEDIFREFYQIGQVQKDGEKGLGLGLSIVVRLCALLGHPISLRSEPGRGSCFMVDLPQVPPSATPKGGAVQEVQPLNRFCLSQADRGPLGLG
ncbi:MAG TPA: MASE1 domain-containing protein [Patescibacteria group bacterium]|nr:MASE1 domain-containing protein [Patescibacteria group bacterium]